MLGARGEDRRGGAGAGPAPPHARCPGKPTQAGPSQRRLGIDGHAAASRRGRGPADRVPGDRAAPAPPLDAVLDLPPADAAGANIVGLLIGMALFSMFFFISLYLQDVLRYSPIKTGICYLPLAVGIIVSAAASGLVTRVGFKPPLIAGILLVAGGLLWFSQVPAAGGSFAADVLGPSLLAGAGFGLAFVPVTIAAVTGTEPHEAGLASGLANTSQQVGGALGLAILATVANSRTQSLFHAGVRSSAVALTKGFDLAFLVGAGFAVGGAILAAVLISSRDGREHSKAARRGEAAGADAAAVPAAADPSLQRAGCSAPDRPPRPAQTEAAQAARCDLRWKAACGLGLLDTGFDPSLLTYFRRGWRGRVTRAGCSRRLRRSRRPPGCWPGSTGGRSTPPTGPRPPAPPSRPRSSSASRTQARSPGVATACSPPQPQPPRNRACEHPRRSNQPAPGQVTHPAMRPTCRNPVSRAAGKLRASAAGLVPHRQQAELSPELRFSSSSISGAKPPAVNSRA